MLLKPSALRSKRASILALSSAVSPETARIGREFLNTNGYKLTDSLDPADCYEKYNYLFSNFSAQERAEALHNLVKNDVELVITARGGYGTLEVLTLIDYELLRKKPVILSGCSDTTALLLAVNKLSGLITFHGPNLLGVVGAGKDEALTVESFVALERLISGEITNPFAGRDFNILSGTKKSGSGRLIGGNLTMLASLTGTPYEPEYKKALLFFEEIGESPYRLHRSLMQLKLAGKLESLSGVLIGQLTNCNHPKGLGPSALDAIKDIFKDYDYPVLSGLPFGHAALNLPLPIGLPAAIAGTRLEISDLSVNKAR